MHTYLNEHQKHAVEALEALSELCKKNNITFFLLAGTTLGAVRHLGMIPWDDDIDVGLLYEDWFRLRELLKTQPLSRFDYVDESIKTDYPRLFGKILYAGESCIDLFLISKWTTNFIKGEFYWQVRKNSVEFYKYSIGYKHIPKPTASLQSKIKYFFASTVRKIGYSIVSSKYKREDYIKLARWNEAKLNSKENDCYINLYSLYRMKKEMIKKEWIDNPSTVLFEDHKYLTVGDTHAYLTHLYGDYMNPPKDKQKIATHIERF